MPKISKKIFFFLTIIFFIFSCKTVQITDENASKKNADSTKKSLSSEEKKENEQIFEFTGFNFSFSEDESVSKDEQIYLLTYNFNFQFKSNKDFFVNYKIYDIDNNLVYSKEKVKSGKHLSNLQAFSINDKFTDNFCYPTLRCKIEITINNKTFAYESEFINPQMPVLENLKAGPIVTKYENKKNNVSMFINLSIKNCLDVKWIHIIPPSEDYYWTMIPKKESSGISSNTIINDSKHKNYIENGKYIVQINLGKSGIIQKDIIIVDFLDNKTSSNYGFPIANEFSSDKNEINLDIQFLDKIDYIELWLYSNIDNKLLKTGTAKILNPDVNLQKKELFNMFFDDSNKLVKLKYNQKYYYKIYIYSKEFNGLKYISISDLTPLIFQGFKLFPF